MKRKIRITIAVLLAGFLLTCLTRCSQAGAQSAPTAIPFTATDGTKCFMIYYNGAAFSATCQ